MNINMNTVDNVCNKIFIFIFILMLKQGTFTWEGGRIHQGDWVNNKAHGEVSVLFSLSLSLSLLMY